MRVALITDTHWGARKGSKLFQDYFEEFYKNVFFPKLEEENISTVIHLGDAFDSRKSIDYQSLEWTKKVILEPLSKYKVHMIVGNHDVYYKNTNNINSPNLLLKNYSNIKTYSDPEIVNIDNTNILFIPWICSDNEEMTYNLVKTSKCSIGMGHLELCGFQAYRGHTMEEGMDSFIFESYKKVFSGHYHTRSDNGKVFYMGNPYEMFWNDVDDQRGFVIFDTETLEHYYVNNPYSLFKIIYYSDDIPQKINLEDYENKIVKVIVRKKTCSTKFEKFIDKLYKSGVAELKVVENFELVEIEDFDISESEDTLSILSRYIEESEVEIDKSSIKNIIFDIYQEACDIV